MKLNKEKFLKTEFGSELYQTIRALDYYLEEISRTSQFKELENYKQLNEDIQKLFAQWKIFQLALKQFYGIKYSFTRTSEYYAVCTDNEEDFLFKEPHEKQTA